ncbi:MAG: hypothetical protein MJ016_07045 [Victivallaceae bacterium]|nr:hypothetical protein [Victivallaceae bacterium]
MSEINALRANGTNLPARETGAASDFKGTSVATLEERIGLSFEGLTPEQQQLLRYKLAEAFIEIKKDSVSAQNRMLFSNEEMTKTIEKAKALSETSNDFSVESTHKTASGNTQIKVQSFRNTSVGIILCVIGIVFILVMLRGC